VTLVSIAYIHGMTSNRSHTYVLCCATGRVHVEKPWEKGNTHDLQLDAMI
jgi:hypothetical protein